MGLAASPDGRWLASGGKNQILYLWDLALTNPMAASRLHGPSHRMVFSRDGSKLVGVEKFMEPVAWAVGHTEEGRTLPHYNAETACFSDEDRWLWTADAQGIKQWDVSTWEEVGERKIPNAQVMEFAPDGSLLATAVTRADHTEVILHGLSDGKMETLALVDGYIAQIALSEDGRYIAAGRSEGSVMIWDRRQDGDPVELQGNGYRVQGLVFAPGSRYLAAAAANWRATWWDLQQRQVMGSFQGHTNQISSLAISPDGKVLYTAGWDESIRIWHPPPTNREAIIRKPVDYRFREAFSPNNLFSLTFNPPLVDLMIVREFSSEGVADRILPIPPSLQGINSFGIGTRGDFVVLGWPARGVGIYELPSMQARWHVPLPDRAVRWPRMSEDGNLDLWDMESRLQVARLKGLRGQMVDHVAFLDGDRTLMAMQPSQISLWRTE